MLCDLKSAHLLAGLKLAHYLLFVFGHVKWSSIAWESQIHEVTLLLQQMIKSKSSNQNKESDVRAHCNSKLCKVYRYSRKHIANCGFVDRQLAVLLIEWDVCERMRQWADENKQISVVFSAIWCLNTRLEPIANCYILYRWDSGCTRHEGPLPSNRNTGQ